MRVVDIRSTGPERFVVSIGEPCGHDERAAFAAAQRAAVTLLGCVSRDAEGGPFDTDALSVSALDRLLLELLESLYGEGAECRAACRSCGKAFEFELGLRQIVATQDAARTARTDDEGWFATAAGTRVRAPRRRDLDSASGPEDLVARLVHPQERGGPREDTAALAEFLEREAPVLSMDLAATCPHCSSSSTVRFDLEDYVGARILGEEPFLLREVHVLAAAYAWGLDNILALRRSERRALVELVDADRRARRPRSDG